MKSIDVIIKRFNIEDIIRRIDRAEDNCQFRRVCLAYSDGENYLQVNVTEGSLSGWWLLVARIKKCHEITFGS